MTVQTENSMSSDDINSNFQVDWVMVPVLLIMCQEYSYNSFPQLCIEISSNKDGNGALVVAMYLNFFLELESVIYDQLPSGFVFQGQFLKTFHMPMFQGKGLFLN